MLRPALLTAFLLLAGCARSEEARTMQVDNATLPSGNNVAQEGEDDELAIGTWQPGLQDEQPVLEFGPVGAASLFSLSCDARRNLLLQRPGAAPTGDLPTMIVTVGSETRQFPVAGTSGVAPMLQASLAPNDPFRTALINAVTRITVRIGDTPPLVMPPSPTIGAYAQQCASGDARTVAAPATGNSAEANGAISVVGNVASNAAGPSGD